MDNPQIEQSQEDLEGVKNLIITKMSSLDQIRIKRKALKEQLEVLFMNDEGYKSQLLINNENRKKMKDVKERLSQLPEVFQLKEDIKELTVQFNETKKDISEYLLLYQTQTGQLSFMDPNGREVKIIQSATPKIVKINVKERRRN